MKFLAAFFASVLLFTACGGDGTGTSEQTETGTETDNGDPETTSGLTVTMQDFSFSPNQVDVEPGEEVTLEVTNSGSAPHTFTAKDLDIDERLDPGSSTEITFTAPDQDVSWLCTIHPQMTGTIAAGGGDAGSGGGGNNGGGNDDADDLDY